MKCSRPVNIVNVDIESEHARTQTNIQHHPTFEMKCLLCLGVSHLSFHPKSIFTLHPIPHPTTELHSPRRTSPPQQPGAPIRGCPSSHRPRPSSTGSWRRTPRRPPPPAEEVSEVFSSISSVASLDEIGCLVGSPVTFYRWMKWWSCR